MATKLEGGGEALVTWPLVEELIFSASLSRIWLEVDLVYLWQSLWACLKPTFTTENCSGSVLLSGEPAAGPQLQHLRAGPLQQHRVPRHPGYAIVLVCLLFWILSIFPLLPRWFFSHYLSLFVISCWWHIACYYSYFPKFCSKLLSIYL